MTTSEAPTSDAGRRRCPSCLRSIRWVGGSWLRRPDQPSITKNLPMHGSPSLLVVSVSGSVTSEDEPLLPNAMGVAGMPGRVRTSLYSLHLTVRQYTQRFVEVTKTYINLTQLSFGRQVRQKIVSTPERFFGGFAKPKIKLANLGQFYNNNAKFQVKNKW